VSVEWQCVLLRDPQQLPLSSQQVLLPFEEFPFLFPCKSRLLPGLGGFLGQSRQRAAVLVLHLLDQVLTPHEECGCGVRGAVDLVHRVRRQYFLCHRRYFRGHLTGLYGFNSSAETPLVLE